MDHQVATERESRALVVREKMEAIRLGLAVALLVVLTTPMYAAFITARIGGGGLGWMGITLALFVVEIAVLSMLGQRARRVDAGVTPWEARLAFALVVGIVPIAIECAITWQHEQRRLWVSGAVFVACAILLHFGRTVGKLVRARA
ncbi:MAG: hypothetical protein ABI321_10025 [Polyangia bacterium]